MVRALLTVPIHRVVLIGPPGAGKSTLTPALIARFGLARIATGDRLRAEIAAGSALGREAAAWVERGELVPDGVVGRVLRACLAAVPATDGFLLDGYPRNPSQAAILDQELRNSGLALTRVLALEVPDAEIVRRLSGRRLCTGAGEPWVLHVDDAAAVARCQARGGSLVQRDDDRPAVIAQRLAVYRSETAPLLERYRHAGLLRTIDATGSARAVRARAIAALTQ